MAHVCYSLDRRTILLCERAVLGEGCPTSARGSDLSRERFALRQVGRQRRRMDTIVMILFASVLCAITALNFIELRRIRKNLEATERKAKLSAQV